MEVGEVFKLWGRGVIILNSLMFGNGICAIVAPNPSNVKNGSKIMNAKSSCLECVKSLVTSGGSVASDAKKLAEPVLLGTSVSLICSAGATTYFPATDQALFTHACIAECAVQAAPFIVSLLPLGFQQQTIHQWLPHPHTRPGGAGPAPHSISKLPCLHLSIHAATHTILPNREVSEHLAQGPNSPPDITRLAEEVCLACMPGFRVGGALGGPGQPGVNFTGSHQT
eukprot:1151835-Pelagomonas_calceolata.AAC.2